MDRLCTNHPDVPAQWECRYCNIAWCAGCIETSTIKSYDISDHQRARFYCPSCSRPLRRRAAPSPLMHSCWAVLPTLALLSFHPQSLLFIVAISITASVLISLGMPALVLVFLWGGMLPLAVSALVQTAQGQLSAPQLSDDIQNYLRHGLKHFCLVFLWFVFFTGDGTSVFTTLSCLIFAVAVVPSFIVVLLLSGSVKKALQPHLLSLTARLLGRSYVCIMFLLASFLAMAFGTSAIIRDTISATAAQLFLIAAVNYFTLVAYQLIGYSIHQHRQVLAPVPAFKQYFVREDQRADDLSQNQVLEIVDQLIAEDRIEDAIGYVDAKAGNALFDLELSQRYYDLLAVHHNVPKQLEHAKVYLDLLAARNKNQELCDIYLACKKEDPSFSPSPATFFSIGLLLNKAGDPRAAAEAFKQFVTVYRHSIMTPKAYFLAATIFHEQLKETEPAVQLLKTMVNAYPDHHMTRSARELLKTLMRKLMREEMLRTMPVFQSSI